MIPDAKWPWFEAWLARHAEARLSASFGAVWVRGLEHLAEASASGSAVVVANHSSWWDGMMLLYLSRRLLQRDVYALMSADGLREFPFFIRGGAFGVELDDRSGTDGAAAIRHAARLLRTPGRLVWIFPQGQERPGHEVPTDFESGAAIVARLGHAPVVPVGLRYVFRGDERPEAFASIGPALAPERVIRRGRAAQERAVQAEVAAIHDALAADPAVHGFRGHLSRPRSRTQRWATALLCAATRPRSLRQGTVAPPKALAPGGASTR